MVLLLSLAGGSVDAVMILGFNVLTAAQTGNTILLAVSIAEGRFATGFDAAVSVIGYMVGAAMGELVIVKRRDSASRLSPVGWGLVVELVALSGLLIYWRLAGHTPAVGTSAGLVAFAAVAMGIQSAAVLRLHLGPTTTYVTGTLTTFMTETIRRLHLVETAPATALAAQDRGSAILPPNGPVLYGVVWLVYAGGACVSGLLFLRVREVALALPIVAIAAAIAAGIRVTEIKIQSGGGSGPVDKGSAPKSAMNMNTGTGTSIWRILHTSSVVGRFHISCRQVARRRRDEYDSTGLS
jgi:uncharacterized membrane protein YoaK (UPF0700 family)